MAAVTVKDLIQAAVKMQKQQLLWKKILRQWKPFCPNYWLRTDRHHAETKWWSFFHRSLWDISRNCGLWQARADLVVFETFTDLLEWQQYSLRRDSDLQFSPPCLKRMDEHFQEFPSQRSDYAQLWGRCTGNQLFSWTWSDFPACWRNDWMDKSANFNQAERWNAANTENTISHRMNFEWWADFPLLNSPDRWMLRNTGSFIQKQRRIQSCHFGKTLNRGRQSFAVLLKRWVVDRYAWLANASIRQASD